MPTMSSTKNSESPSLSSIHTEFANDGLDRPWSWYCTGGIWFGAETSSIIEGNEWPAAIGPHRFAVHTIVRDNDVAMRANGMQAGGFDSTNITGRFNLALVEWMRFCDDVVDYADDADDSDEEPAVTLEGVRRAMTRVWTTLPDDAEAIMALDRVEALEVREAIDASLDGLNTTALLVVLEKSQGLARGGNVAAA